MELSYELLVRFSREARNISSFFFSMSVYVAESRNFLPFSVSLLYGKRSDLRFVEKRRIEGGEHARRMRGVTTSRERNDGGGGGRRGRGAKTEGEKESDYPAMVCISCVDRLG